MKVLYVAKKYNIFGNPESGFSYAHCNFYDTLTKMNGGKYQVIYFPFDEIIKKEGKEKIQEKLMEKVNEENPDLVFFIVSLIDTTALEVETIKSITHKTKTLNFFTDDYWQFEKFSKYLAPYLTWVVTSDPKAPQKYHQSGFNNIIEMQYACNHFIYKPFNLEKIYDVSFVGYPHGNREKIIQEIKKAGIKVNCWGRGWPAGRISQEEMIRIFSQSKINLNFSKNSGILWKELVSVFFSRNYDKALRFNSPKKWLAVLKSLPSSVWQKAIKGRVFEILGCGSFLLTDCLKDLKEYYQVGKEIICFQDTDDLIEKIKYYLANEKEREGIAKAGFQRTLTEHTYEKRFNNIFGAMGLC
jgi:spore maturation protein CgeB